MKVAVVTGVNGFVGPHLVNELLKNNFEVIGVGNEKKPVEQIKDKLVKYHRVDMTSQWDLNNDVDVVFHLAGFSAVGPSYDNPQIYINGNTSMITNLCEFYLNKRKKPRILVISSGAIYDNNQQMPIKESSSMGYTSPYAVSKVTVENQVIYYQGRGLDIIVARPFNHIGPGQNVGFLLPDLVSKIKKLSKSEQEIVVGNLATKRDYTDVRDIVHAYVLIIAQEKIKHTIYNVCSGNSVSGFELLELVKEKMNRLDIKIKVDKSLIRPTDIMEISGDNSLLKIDTGWEPRYTLNQTIRDFLGGE